MALFAAALLGLTLQVAQDTAAPAPPADAYLDAGAAEMVRRARSRTRSENRLIEGYRTTARQQMSMAVNALGRERVAVRQQRAAWVEWERNGPARVEILGSRQATPLVSTGETPGSEGDLAAAAVELAFEPDRDWVLGAPGLGGDAEETGFIHPLATASEDHYRFRSGDPSSIRLPDGRTIRLVELQVVPRRSGHRLVSGSLWLDAESFAPVRGAFRFTVPVAVGAHSEKGSWGVPGEFTLLMVEYGLWEGRWWLPRLFLLEGSATLGPIAARLRFETAYEGYQIFSEPAGAGRPPSVGAWGDSARARAFASREDTTSECGPARRVAGGGCREVEIWTPRDRNLLLRGERLPPVDANGEADLLTDAEVREGIEALYSSGVLSALLPRPRLEWKWIDPALFRFNRVEGATLGTTASAEVARYRLSGSAWVGTADREVGFEAALARSRYTGRETVRAYRRLDAFSPRDRPFGFGNTLSALALGHDGGDYFRTLGVEAEWSPAAAGPAYEWRAYAERQEPVRANTGFSLRHAFGGAEARPNPAADRADQFGVSGNIRLSTGVDPAGWRAGLELAGAAEAGSYRFVRPAATGYLGVPLPGPLVGALEVGAGSSLGRVPVQRLWYLGGPSTVRGIGTDARVAGESFWRARAEIATALPGVRLVGFGDAGWAGARQEVSLDPMLLSAGVGASFLDGLFRVDLARPLRGDSGWRLELYLGGAL